MQSIAILTFLIWKPTNKHTDSEQANYIHTDITFKTIFFLNTFATIELVISAITFHELNVLISDGILKTRNRKCLSLEKSLLIDLFYIMSFHAVYNFSYFYYECKCVCKKCLRIFDEER